jgi:prepilin-type N-terminal cleavage/methylation domain-containing protein
MTQKKNQKGMTLLEVLLAVAILAIILISVVPFILNAFKNNEMVEDSHQSLYYAKEKLTYIQSSTDIQNFLRSIQTTQPSVISQTPYQNLNLISDILLVPLQEKLSDTSPVTTANYYLFNIKDGGFITEVYIRATADYTGAATKLYRTVIYVYDENRKKLTESFGYTKYK